MTRFEQPARQLPLTEIPNPIEVPPDLERLYENGIMSWAAAEEIARRQQAQLSTLPPTSLATPRYARIHRPLTNRQRMLADSPPQHVRELMRH